MIVPLLGRYLRWLDRCRTCGVDAIDYSLLPSFPNLVAGEALKGGREYVCAKCRALWFAPASRRFLNKVVNADLYRSWRDSNAAPTEAQRSILTGIGAVADHYGDTLYIPCETVDKRGRRFQKALILAAKEPHAGKWYKPDAISLLSADVEMTPSKYALPIDVRRATMATRETSMGRSPVGIADGSGGRYTLVTRGHFIEVAGILGPGFSLDAGAGHGKNEVFPHEPDHYYLCDWVDLS